MRRCLALVLGLLAGCAAPRPNVILICVDDLRPELGCYGANYVRSPNIDSFAKRGLLYQRHYVAFPTCGASRAAMLTGRYPTRPTHWTNGAFKTPKGETPEPRVSLPEAFRKVGYRTVCLGKVSHSHDGRNNDGSPEVPGAWDSMPTDPGKWGHARHLLHGYVDGKRRQAGKSPLWESADVSDTSYPDGILAQQAVDELRRLASRRRPFFLAVGFFKPHLPFAAPARYWSYYRPEELPIVHGRPPAMLGRVNSCRQSGEVTRNYACPPWSDRKWDVHEQRRMRHAYYACVSFVDAQIGKLLNEIAFLHLYENTIVVLWSDHGWHLGEQGLMGKHTTFEASLRSPLVIAAPGAKTGQTDTLASAYDLFPTLCELAKVPAPKELAGVSLASELRGEPPAPRAGVASFWRAGRHRAHVWRSADWRAVRWFDPDDDSTASVELYDMRNPHPERLNIASRHPRLAERLLGEFYQATRGPISCPNQSSTVSR